MKRRFYLPFLLFVLGLTATPQPAHALLLSGNTLFSTGGNEHLSDTFVGSSASFTNLSYEVFPNFQFLFNEDTATPGAVADLGVFGSATPLIFKIDVFDSASSFLHSWYTNPLINTDLTIHAIYLPINAHAYLLGFEDYAITDPRYDGDFNDMLMIISDVRPDPNEPMVPEPASLGLIGCGVAAMGAAGWLCRRTRNQ